MNTKRYILVILAAMSVGLCPQLSRAVDIEIDKSPGEPEGFEAIKMTVRTNGVYFVDADDLASLMDVAAADVKSLIASGGVSLRSQGRELGYVPVAGGEGIYFYGVGSDSQFSAYNVYWLRWFDGDPVEVSSSTAPPDGGIATESMYTRHEEKDLLNGIGFSDDIEKDNWTWAFINAAATNGTGIRDFAVAADELSSTPARAVLKTYLKGFSTVGMPREHNAVVYVNGTEAGEGVWMGTTDHVFSVTFDQDLLLEGANTISVTGRLASGVAYSLFRVDSFDLTYLKRHTAIANEVALQDGANAVVTADGFGGSDIFAVGVADGDNIVEIPAVTVAGGPDYRASFAPSDDKLVYAVFTASDRPAPDSVEAVVVDKLTAVANAARYVVITVPEFATAASNLVAYRESRGLKAGLVFIDDIYNDFNYGIPSPWAIRDFLGYTATNWSEPVEYAVLAGEGNYDYRDNLGKGDNIIPTGFVNTPDALFASDGTLADFDDDGVPDLAIGRLPVLTDVEMQSVVDKIKSYEAAADASWKTKIVFIADVSDNGGNFDASTETLASIVPGGFTTQLISRSEHSLPVASNLVKQALNDGALLINYFGHGSLDSMSKDKMFSSAVVPQLTNASRLAIMTSMSCLIGQYSSPDFDCLGEELVLGPASGVAAVWAPSGRSMNRGATQLCGSFYDSVLVDGNAVLGDAIRAAMSEYAAAGTTPYMLKVYNLIGDPAMTIAGFNSTYGYDYAKWRDEVFTAVELGTLGTYERNDDPDGDGIVNIIEYAVLTDPKRFNNLRSLFGVDESKPIGQIAEPYDIVVTFERRKGLNDVVFVVEASADLVTWSADPQWIVAEEIIDIGDEDKERVNVYVKSPDASRAKGFVRMRLVYQD